MVVERAPSRLQHERIRVHRWSTLAEEPLRPPMGHEVEQVVVTLMARRRHHETRSMLWPYYGFCKGMSTCQGVKWRRALGSFSVDDWHGRESAWR